MKGLAQIPCEQANYGEPVGPPIAAPGQERTTTSLVPMQSCYMEIITALWPIWTLRSRSTRATL